MDGPWKLPYSADLLPCKYHLFGPLKEGLGGQQFDEDTGVEEFVHNWLQTRTSFFLRGRNQNTQFIG